MSVPAEIQLMERLGLGISRAQGVWEANSKKKKTHRLEIPHHEDLCQALWRAGGPECGACEYL